MRNRKLQSGFSIIELLVVCVIGVTLVTIAVPRIQSTLNNLRVDNACSMTVSQLRLARQKAVDDRLVYILRFQAPRSIQLYKVVNGIEGKVGEAITLADDVEFRVEPGVPTDSKATPDNFPMHSEAIDLDVDYDDGTRNEVRFHPDGSARDSKNRTNNGVIYVARPGELMSSRAVSLFGTTGRVRGWRASGSADSFQWK